MLSTTDALIEKQISSEESHARDQARASHWVFTALQLMQLCKYLFSSKRIIILVSLYLESSLPFLTRSKPLAHTCCRWAFGWGWPQGVRALPTMLCCAILPTDTWLKYSSLWFAHCDSPCSRIYFTISPCPVLAAWCSKEPWSGPWINKLAPFLQHSMNWKKQINKQKKMHTHTGKG